MKIYFAGSIRGGRDNKENHFKIINHLKKFGQVLTEHIGDQSLTALGESLSDNLIFERDLSWIKDADVIVIEASTPSLGVGYEIRLAEELGKRVLCLFQPQEGKKLSGMIVGNNNLDVKEYRTLEEVFRQIDDFFKNFTD